MDYVSIALGALDEERCVESVKCVLGVEGAEGVQSPAARGVGLDAPLLCDHLERLHRLIAEGCCAGLHQHLLRVPAEIVRSILRSAGSGVDADTTGQTCRRAGEAATLAALIDEYRYQLHLLKGLDRDAAVKWGAALELCLCQPTETRP